MPHDGVAVAVEGEPLAHGGLAAAECTLPVFVADDDDGGAADRVLFAGEVASIRRHDAQGRKETGGDGHGAGLLGIGTLARNGVTGKRRDRHARERPLMIPDELIFRLRERLRVPDERVEGAEERRVRADADRDRQNGDERKTRGLEQRARGVSQIGHWGRLARVMPIEASGMTEGGRWIGTDTLDLRGGKRPFSKPGIPRSESRTHCNA